MTLAYRGIAYPMNSTDVTTPVSSIDCQYRGVTYHVQPVCSIQRQIHHLQYRGAWY